MDEKARRDEMEASENTAMSREGGSDFALHRVDPDRVSRLLSTGTDSVGYARLELMVTTVFDRLVGGEGGRVSRS
jgi:hypothetical protein